MTSRRKIIAGVLALLLAGLAWFGYGLWRMVYVTVPDAYAVWNTASHIDDYMDAHNGAWPRRWDDLRSAYEISNQPNPAHMADLMARVDVDWNAEPHKLAAMPQPLGNGIPFRAIWLKDGSSAHWSGAEPNWLVWNHLNKRDEKKPEAQTRPATSRSVE